MCALADDAGDEDARWRRCRCGETISEIFGNRYLWYFAVCSAFSLWCGSSLYQSDDCLVCSGGFLSSA